MDCPNCGYFIDVQKHNGKIKCRYCGSLLSYDLKKDKLTIIEAKKETPRNNFIIMECPGCKANLEIDKENLLAYCPYCGKKLFYNIDGLSYVITEKEKTKQKEINKNFQLEKIKIEHEENRKDNLHSYLLVLLCIFLMIFICVLFYLVMKL